IAQRGPLPPGAGGASPPGQPALPPGAAEAGGRPAKPVPFRRQEPKLKPNDPCWCGSGKKFKKCHGGAAGAGH
ncbi:MAG: SEC-C domain-containing protein, partial [Candidatus Sumerlaeia bacterium]|nr:SEC-C domain-containing protein [Candidatus Sumerlaeia bacterium]